MSPDPDPVTPNPARTVLSDDGEGMPAPVGQSKAEVIQRLQIGLFGLAAMILMVMLANIVMERANEADAAAVPEAVDDSTLGGKAAGVKDPLADAGVVPDLPAAGTDAQKDGVRQGNRPARDVP